MTVNAHRFVVVGVLLGLLSGCAFLPKEPSVADPRSVYAWPVAKCPSLSAPTAPEAALLVPGVVAGLATPLLTDLASGLVAIPVAAIQNAAAADTAGFKANGQNARYYFQKVKEPEGSTTAESATSTWGPPGCYVVAYTSFVAGEGSVEDWCNDAEFAASLPDTCSDDGKAVLRTVGKVRTPVSLRPKTPAFYAEVALIPSSYKPAGVAIVKPQVVALHYPRSLIEPKSGKQRLITISLNLATPVAAQAASTGSSTSSAGDQIKAASLAIVLQGVTPARVISEDSLASQQASWIAMPTAISALGTKLADPDPLLSYYFPVNISSTLSEIGDPSVFLQAFAKAVAGSAADYSKALASAVPPVPTVAAEQQNTTAKATLESAVAQAETDKAKYLASCTPTPSTTASKATANAAYLTVIADRSKANAAALGITASYGTVSPSIPYDPIDKDLQKCF